MMSVGRDFPQLKSSISTSSRMHTGPLKAFLDFTDNSSRSLSNSSDILVYYLQTIYKDIRLFDTDFQSSNRAVDIVFALDLFERISRIEIKMLLQDISDCQLFYIDPFVCPHFVCRLLVPHSQPHVIG